MGIPRYRRDMTSEMGTLHRRTGEALSAATRTGRGEDTTGATTRQSAQVRLAALESEVAQLRDLVEELRSS